MIKQFLIRDPVIEAVTLNLAREVLAFSPAGRLYADSACEFLAHHLIHRTITGERGKPEDVAAMVRFLCGPQARYFTGQAIHADGVIERIYQNAKPSSAAISNAMVSFLKTEQ